MGDAYYLSELLTFAFWHNFLEVRVLPVYVVASDGGRVPYYRVSEAFERFAEACLPIIDAPMLFDGGEVGIPPSHRMA